MGRQNPVQVEKLSCSYQNFYREICALYETINTTCPDGPELWGLDSLIELLTVLTQSCVLAQSRPAPSGAQWSSRLKWLIWNSTFILVLCPDCSYPLITTVLLQTDTLLHGLAICETSGLPVVEHLHTVFYMNLYAVRIAHACACHEHYNLIPISVHWRWPYLAIMLSIFIILLANYPWRIQT